MPGRPTTSCGARAPALDLDDSGWATLDVPGHWRADPEFAASDGPILYRRRFEQAPPPPGTRRWITFDGVFYQADAWLDGAYLGDPEGYFFPHTFEITGLAAMSNEHVLAVEVDLLPRAGHLGAAQHHRHAAALRGRRPRLEPRRPVAHRAHP